MTSHCQIASSSRPLRRVPWARARPRSTAGPAFRDALSGHPERHLIDPGRAAAQHRAFVVALERAGISVVRLPEDPDLPDAPFVSDTPPRPRAGEPRGPTALFVVARPGRGRVAPRWNRSSRARAASAAGVEEVEIEDPGTLEGGDIVVFGDRVAIGVSGRTNVCGAGQLALAVQSAGYRAFLCPVPIACTSPLRSRPSGRAAARDRGGLRLPGRRGTEVAPSDEVERMLVPDTEPGGANVLALGGHASSRPVTRAPRRPCAPPGRSWWRWTSGSSGEPTAGRRAW